MSIQDFFKISRIPTSRQVLALPGEQIFVVLFSVRIDLLLILLFITCYLEIFQVYFFAKNFKIYTVSMTFATRILSVLFPK